MEQGIAEALGYMSFPREHWRCLRTINPLERLNRDAEMGAYYLFFYV